MELKKLFDAYFYKKQYLDTDIIRVIFGAGRRGQRLLYMLKKNGIEVKYFCDNDISKQGSVICGVPVIAIEQLTGNKDNYHILVSPCNGWEIVVNLKEKGFCFVMAPDIVELVSGWENMRYSANKMNFPLLGHFYSLYPDFEEIRSKEELLFSEERDIKDIDLNEEAQIEILHKMSVLYDSIPG